MAGKADAGSVRRIFMDLYKSNKLIPFIGAGFSARFNIPTFDKLIDIIAKELKWDTDIFKLNGSFYELAGYYVAIKGSIGPLRSVLDKDFNPSDDSIKKSRAHIALTKFKSATIYTTNYDNIIERAFKINKKNYHVINGIDDMLILKPDHTEIVKFHGTFADDKSLVLTEESYFERLGFESALDLKLRGDSLYKTLLFIGHSLNDVNIRYLLYKLTKIRETCKIHIDTPMAIMATFSSKEVQNTLLSKWNVLTYELDPVDMNSSIDEFMENFV